jgi:hypothetical protein
MKSRRVISSLLLASFMTSGIVVLAGCDAGSGQIPLANVPPPPEGFGAAKENSKLPKGGSPTDANSRRK